MVSLRPTASEMRDTPFGLELKDKGVQKLGGGGGPRAAWPWGTSAALCHQNCSLADINRGLD